MTMAALNRIDCTIEIRATPERVWQALTSKEELSAWFQVAIEGTIAAGSEVWMRSTHPTHAGMRWPVRIVELTPPRRMVWRWHPGAVDPTVDYSKESQTTVTFSLEPWAKGTRLSVAETGFDEISLARRAKVFADNRQGWAEVLVWLQSHVETTR